MMISMKTVTALIFTVIASAGVTYYLTGNTSKERIITRSSLASGPTTQAVAVSQEISNAPFGIPMGTDPKSLGAKPGPKATFFEVPSPPRSHPEFEKVMIQAAPNVGVCWVKGIGRNVASNDFGNEIRSHVDEIESQLETKYGKPELRDFLLSGSLWTEPQYWMMGLRKGDRVYGYVWDTSTLNAKGWKDLKSIYVAATGSGSEPYVIVEYYFNNVDQCEAAAKKAAGESL